MNLESGRKLGPYEIVSLIGVGGMGEVYRARDHRLDRTVAIKVLPSDVVATPSRRIRFEREAKAIAALSHANICSIYDVGSDDGIEYLVMEYLEGETLADRIERGPLPVNLVLRYGVQIAEALHHAHRAGIAHRDLKPANVMITAAGAKLLDFGLAKIVAAESSDWSDSNIPTLAAPLTAEGTIMGTFQYMSPEQVEGRAVDARTDIFALGVILFEMATGQRPFGGSSRTSLIAAILSVEPPPIRSLQPSLPPALERIIVTALEKNPDDRWQTAHDVARQLRWMLDSSPSGEGLQPVSADAKRRTTQWIPLLAVAAAAALLAWLAMRSTRSPVPQMPVVRLDLALPPGFVAAGSGDSNAFALAPDGKTLSFTGFSGGARMLLLRDLDSNEVRKVEGSAGAQGPFWSPDGEWIGFSARGKLWKTRKTGNTPPEALCDVSEAGAMATWRNHTILFSNAFAGRLGIFRVSDMGGVVVPVTPTTRDEAGAAWPCFLPDGEHFFYLSMSSRSIDRDLVLASLDGKQKKALLKNVSRVKTVGNGVLMYVRDGKLLTQKYDAAKATLVGEAETVADDVSYFYPTARADFDAIESGMVVYRTNSPTGRLSLVDRRGAEKKLLEGSAGRFFDLALAPDGKRIAVTILAQATGLGDIWIYDLARGVRDRFTSDPGMEFAPVWSRDGQWLIYSDAQGGVLPHVVRRAIAGSAVEELTPRGMFQSARSVSSDGETLYVVDHNSRTKSDIYRFSMQSKREEPMMNTAFDEGEPEISSDGKWLAYSSDATGAAEVYLQRITGEKAARIRVSSDGGSNPRWRGDGTELFYVAGDRRSVSVLRSVSGSWSDATRETLFTVPSGIAGFAVEPDGQTFVILQHNPAPNDALFHVILGWH
ncbi:MAG: protein kinase [Thermoanaerobaculia bacterium]